MIFAKNCQFHTEKIENPISEFTRIIQGHLGSNAFSLIPLFFLQVFSLSTLFGDFPKSFSQYLQVSFQVFSQVFFQVFSKYSKSKFFLRCGNSVDFLYGGLIVRVSSCLSAFRSFALHTFFKSRDST